MGPPLILRSSDTVAAVSSEEISSHDSAGGLMGELMATRVVLWEAVDRLSADSRDELRERIHAMVDRLREGWTDDASPGQVEIMDGLEFIAHQMRYHPARQLTEGEPSGEFARICLKCDKFPLDDDEACPQCGSRRFLSVLRI